MSRKPRPRNLEEIAAAQRRRRDVYECMMRGVPVFEIATRHGVHTNTIYRDQGIIRKEWLTPDGLTQEEVAEEVAYRVARLEHIQKVCWESFERSREDATERSMRERPCPDCQMGIVEGTRDWCPTCDGDGVLVGEVRVKVAGQAGDPRFLALIKECEKEIIRLKGLDRTPPIKIEAEVRKTVNIQTNGKRPPRDVLIAAMRAVARLREATADGEETGEEETIDVESRDVE